MEEKTSAKALSLRERRLAQQQYEKKLTAWAEKFNRLSDSEYNNQKQALWEEKQVFEHAFIAAIHAGKEKIPPRPVVFAGSGKFKIGEDGLPVYTEGDDSPEFKGLEDEDDRPRMAGVYRHVLGREEKLPGAGGQQEQNPAKPTIISLPRKTAKTVFSAFYDTENESELAANELIPAWVMPDETLYRPPYVLYRTDNGRFKVKLQTIPPEKQNSYKKWLFKLSASTPAIISFVLGFFYTGFAESLNDAFTISAVWPPIFTTLMALGFMYALFKYTPPKWAFRISVGLTGVLVGLGFFISATFSALFPIFIPLASAALGYVIFDEFKRRWVGRPEGADMAAFLVVAVGILVYRFNVGESILNASSAFTYTLLFAFTVASLVYAGLYFARYRQVNYPKWVDFPGILVWPLVAGTVLGIAMYLSPGASWLVDLLTTGSASTWAPITLLAVGSAVLAGLIAYGLFEPAFRERSVPTGIKLHEFLNQDLEQAIKKLKGLVTEVLDDTRPKTDPQFLVWRREYEKLKWNLKEEKITLSAFCKAESKVLEGIFAGNAELFEVTIQEKMKQAKDRHPDLNKTFGSDQKLDSMGEVERCRKIKTALLHYPGLADLFDVSSMVRVKKEELLAQFEATKQIQQMGRREQLSLQDKLKHFQAAVKVLQEPDLRAVCATMEEVKAAVLGMMKESETSDISKQLLRNIVEEIDRIIFSYLHDKFKDKKTELTDELEKKPPSEAQVSRIVKEVILILESQEEKGLGEVLLESKSEMDPGNFQVKKFALVELLFRKCMLLQQFRNLSALQDGEAERGLVDENIQYFVEALQSCKEKGLNVVEIVQNVKLQEDKSDLMPNCLAFAMSRQKSNLERYIRYTDAYYFKYLKKVVEEARLIAILELKPEEQTEFQQTLDGVLGKELKEEARGSTKDANAKEFAVIDALFRRYLFLQQIQKMASAPTIESEAIQRLNQSLQDFEEAIRFCREQNLDMSDMVEKVQSSVQQAFQDRNHPVLETTEREKINTHIQGIMLSCIIFRVSREAKNAGSVGVENEVEQAMMSRFGNEFKGELDQIMQLNSGEQKGVPENAYVKQVVITQLLFRKHILFQQLDGINRLSQPEDRKAGLDQMALSLKNLEEAVSACQARGLNVANVLSSVREHVNKTFPSHEEEKAPTSTPDSQPTIKIKQRIDKITFDHIAFTLQRYGMEHWKLDTKKEAEKEANWLEKIQKIVENVEHTVALGLTVEEQEEFRKELNPVLEAKVSSTSASEQSEEKSTAGEEQSKKMVLLQLLFRKRMLLREFNSLLKGESIDREPVEKSLSNFIGAIESCCSHGLNVSDIVKSVGMLMDKVFLDDGKSRDDLRKIILRNIRKEIDAITKWGTKRFTIQLEEVSVASDQKADTDSKLFGKTKGISLVEEPVDLRVYPSTPSFLSGTSDAGVGDLDGNFLRLIYSLIKEGILKGISKEDYATLVEIHRQVVIAGFELATGYVCENKGENVKNVEENFEEFKRILSKAKIDKDKIRILTLIGDTLADRCGNDKFMIEVFKRLHIARVKFEIPLSNHDWWLLEFFETGKLPFDNVLHNYQGISLPNMLRAYGEDQLSEIPQGTKDTLFAEIKEYYIPHLVLLSYKLSVDKRTIVPQTHARIPHNQLPYIVYNLAQKMGVRYQGHTPEELANTIDAINERFQQEYVQQNKIHTLFSMVKKLPAGLFQCDKEGNIQIPRIEQSVDPVSTDFLDVIADELKMEKVVDEPLGNYVDRINAAFQLKGQAFWEQEYSVYLLMWGRASSTRTNDLVMPDRQRSFQNSCNISFSVHGHIGSFPSENGYCNLDGSLGTVRFEPRSLKYNIWVGELSLPSTGPYKVLRTDPGCFHASKTVVRGMEQKQAGKRGPASPSGITNALGRNVVAASTTTVLPSSTTFIPQQGKFGPPVPATGVPPSPVGTAQLPGGGDDAAPSKTA